MLVIGWLSWWMLPWGLLLAVTDILTTCVAVTFRVRVRIWRWLSRRQSQPATVLLRTTFTPTIKQLQTSTRMSSDFSLYYEKYVAVSLVTKFWLVRLDIMTLKCRFLFDWLVSLTGWLINLTLFLRRGGCCNPPPFRIFPRAVFAKIAIRSIYPPFAQIPMYLWKNFQTVFAMKKVGGGGGGGMQQLPRPEREGVVAKINKFL